jgi:hypothetical protein
MMRDQTGKSSSGEREEGANLSNKRGYEMDNT